jgi:hypothetical protein
LIHSDAAVPRAGRWQFDATPSLIESLRDRAK